MVAPIGNRPRRLPEVVAEQMQEFIFESKLRPGDKMPTEPELAKMYDVSRQVVREAARLLDQRGLVEIRAGRGMTVSALSADGVSEFYRLLLRFDPENFTELMEVRQILEPSIARLAAGRRTSSHVEKMRAIIDQAQASLDDFDKCLALDLAFHDAVSECSGNRLLARLAEPVNSTLREVYRVPTAYLASQPSTIQEHLAILEAIENGDADEADEATRRHLARIEREGSHLMPSPLPAGD
jgi:GntR family transcriptional regulator, transcriptional repressor for pyruvate dehydrogenase complex